MTYSTNNITAELLDHLYLRKKQSVSKIAKKVGCSQNNINYWLLKYGIKKRTISDAIYTLKNPHGDPFKFIKPRTINEAIRYGVGLGLYWGEGLKRGKGGLRLGNTDARMLKDFIKFLRDSFGVKRSRLRFGLQIFNDISPSIALNYWTHKLGVDKNQFYKIIISKVRGPGTYKYKSEFGVCMVYFNNVRLKELIISMIDNIR